MKLHKTTVVQCFLGTLFILVIFGVGSALITNVLGVIYPVFMTFYSLEHDSNSDDSDKQWLTYWAVFGILSIVDQFTGVLLGLIPFYYPLKLGFLIWLAHPSTQGAKLIFFNMVQPFWQEHETNIEDLSKGIEKKFKDGMNKTVFANNK